MDRRVYIVSIVSDKKHLVTYRIAKYNRLPSLTGSIGPSISSGGFAVVTNPPASSKIAIPAATSLQMLVF